MGLIEELASVYDLECVSDRPMKKCTSLGVGGNAKYFVTPKSLYALNSAVKIAKKNKIRYKAMGNGTNLLVADGGFDGMIISTAGLKDVFLKKNGIFAASGVLLSRVAELARDNGFSGLEALSGIPATVGGAVFQNAGAFDVSVSDLITEVVTLCRGKLKTRLKEDCGFSYRKSRFCRGGEIIVSATFGLTKRDKSEIAELTETYLARRRETQPQGKSCGSVFLNSSGVPAGKLIEEAGLKGFTVGGASVSLKHANFITTTSAATAADVYNLILHIKNTVKDKFGCTLKEEVEFVGEF